MTVIKRLKSWLQDSFSLPQRYALSPRIRRLLGESPLVIADVGAAMGTDPRWHPIRQLIHFVTFEPDQRSRLEETERCTNFATGLGSAPGSQALHLTALPAASSVYQINHHYLDDFAVREWLEPIGTTRIAIDTFDRCLESTDKSDVTLLKIDTEGSDLDILYGATSALDRSLLGVEVEVTFAPRHVGAPFFGEVDTFLRDQGYQLHDLETEHWLRKNLTFGANVHPQLIYGNAVYLLTYERLLERLKTVSPEEAERTIAKLTLLMLGYGFHDYALELIEKLEKTGLLSHESAAGFRRVVRRSVRGHTVFFLRSTARLLTLCAALLLLLPVRRGRTRTWTSMRRLVGNMSYELSRVARRGGIHGSCITEIS